MIDIEKTNKTTKDAWRENWQDIKIKTILEIFDYPRVKKVLGIIKPYLPKDGRIIEAGCGLGPWVIKLNSLDYDVVGIDYQESCIKKIKEYDSGQRVYVADIKNTPFADKSFDAYLSFGVIEHFAEGPDAALQEAYRILSDSGRLVLSVPYKNIFLKIKSPINYLKRNYFIRTFFGKPIALFYYQKYFKIAELKKVLAKSGFIIDKVMPVDHIFSLVEFSGIFRNKKSYDGENRSAVRLGEFLEKYLPWASAGSILVFAHKGGTQE